MNRSVVVNLVANVSSWNRGIASASKSLKDAADKNKQQIEAMSNQVGMLGAAMVAAAGVSVKKFMDFDAAMSAVQSSTRESTENMSTLRAAALEAGAATVYSATESAKAIEELGKSGMSTADIVGGALSGSLALAASEGMAVADAAEIMSSAMNQFSLKGDKASHVADLLAAGAGKAQGSAHELGMALNQSGLVANQFGLSIEDTTGTLAAFASAGLIGSDAGTSLRSMLLHLANPAADTRELMDKLGISAYDASGKFIGMAGLADQLATATKNLSQEQRDQALAQIFGTDAIRGANILLKEGADGIRDWTAAVDEQGYAADAANARLDNLKGDLEALGGAFDTLMISMGEGGNGPLRMLVQGATEALNVFNELPGPIKQSITLLVGGGGLVLLGVAGMVKLSASIAQTKAQMAELGLMTGKTGRAMSTIGKIGKVASGALLGATLLSATANWESNLGNVEASADDLSAALTRLGKTGDATDLNKLLSGESTNWDWSHHADDQATAIGNLGDALSRMKARESDGSLWNPKNFFSTESGDSLIGGSAAWNQAVKSIEALDGAMASAVSSGDTETLAAAQKYLADEALRVGLTADEAAAFMPKYSSALKDAGVAAVESGADVVKAAQEAEAAQRSTEAAYESFVELYGGAAAAFIDVGKAYDGVIEKNIEVAQSTADATADSSDSWETYYNGVDVSMKDYLKGLQEQVDAQEAWKDNLTKLASRVSEETLASLAALGPEGSALVADLVNASDKQLAKLDMATVAKTETDKFIGEILSAQDRVPELQVHSSVTGYDATYTRLQSIQDKIDSINGRKVGIHFAQGQGGSGGITYSSGGSVFGPGTGTSDSIPAMLSNGEHVLTASDVEKAGGQHAVYRMRGLLQSGMLRFASGGAVGDKVAVDKRKVINQRKSVKEAEKDLAAAEKASTKASRVSADTSSKDKAKKEKAKKAARAAQDEVKDARKKVAQEKKRLAEAEKDLSDSRKARDTENRRRSDIRGLRSEQETDVRRGTTLERVTSGLSGGLTAVDAALSLANSGTLSSKKSAELRKVAQQAEKDLTQQYKILDETNKKIEEQSTLLSNVSSMRNQISQQMMGEVRLSDVLTSSTKQYTNARGDIWHSSDGSTTPAAIRDYLAKKLEKARTFNSKLDALRKKGAPAAMLQEVLAGGVEGGTMLATALLDASWGEWSDITNTWKALETEAGITGDIGTLSAFGTTSAAVESDLAKQTTLAEESKNILATIANTLSGATTLSLQGYSEGGWITGGIPGKDSVPFVGMPGEFVVKAGPAAQNANFLEHINRGGSPKFVSTAGQYASVAGSASKAALGTPGPVYVTIPDIYVHNPITGTDVRAVARQTVLAEISSTANAMAGGYA